VKDKDVRNHFVARGGVGFSGFFGFAQQEKQAKPNKLENLPDLTGLGSTLAHRRLLIGTRWFE
jgi:hypothetical protein